MASNFFSKLRSGAGVATGELGHIFGLPELGLSERIAGSHNQTPVFGTSPSKVRQQQGTSVFPNLPSGAATGLPIRQTFNPAPQGMPPSSQGQPNSNLQDMLRQMYSQQGAAPQGGGGGFASPMMAQPMASSASSSSPTGDTGNIFSSPISPSRYVSLNGSVYDINDPNQLAAFQAARQAYAGQLLGQASNEYGNDLGSINADLSGLDQQGTEVMNQYNTGVKGLNDAYDTGTSNRANYFAQLSPNAFQSSQGDSQQFANNQRLEGLGQLDTTLNQNQQSIATNRAQVQQQRDQLGQAYNQFTGNVQGNLAASPDSYTQPDSIGQFSFDYAAPQGAQTTNVDLSQYTPYINFDQLANSPAANYYQTALAPYKNNLSAKDQYLGYSPTASDKNYINQYLKKGF